MLIESIPLDIHTYYDTRIQIWTKEVVDAVIEIVRRTDSEEGVYHYGAVVYRYDRH